MRDRGTLAPAAVLLLTVAAPLNAADLVVDGTRRLAARKT